MADLRKVEVFVASPVDVKVERARVDAVVGRIAAEFEGIAEFPKPISTNGTTTPPTGHSRRKSLSRPTATW